MAAQLKNEAVHHKQLERRNTDAMWNVNCTPIKIGFLDMNK